MSYRQRCAARRRRTRIARPCENFMLKGKKVVRARDLFRWARWFEGGKRIVRRTEISPGLVVSTVFLGIDHGFGRPGAPVLFEWATMRERAPEEIDRDLVKYHRDCARARETGEVAPLPFYVRRWDIQPEGRCCTYKQAIRMHNRAVDELRAGVRKVEPEVTELDEPTGFLS